MKAPEKIYLQEPTKVRTEKVYDNDIEYTRTDAFIEKACEWLNDWFTDDSCKCGIPITKTAREDFFNDFKKAMEE